MDRFELGNVNDSRIMLFFMPSQLVFACPLLKRHSLLILVFVFLLMQLALNSFASATEKVIYYPGGGGGLEYHYGWYETHAQSYAACTNALQGKSWTPQSNRCYDYFDPRTGELVGVAIDACTSWCVDEITGMFYVGICPMGEVFNKITGECGNVTQNGVPPKLSCVADPINVITGNVFESEVDYSSYGSDLRLVRFYNSSDRTWRTNFSTHLSFSASGDQVALTKPDGGTAFFKISGNDVSSNSLDFGKLAKLENSWTYTGINNEQFYFDGGGKLVTVKNPQGSYLHLSYSSNGVVISDDNNKSVILTQDDKYQPLAFEAPGLKITYNYDAVGNSNRILKSVTRIYNGNSSKTRNFRYEDPNNSLLLTAITDERGILQAAWGYDDQGRATLNYRAGDAGRTNIYYSPTMSAVTNELGLSTFYILSQTEGEMRVSYTGAEATANCPYSDKSYTYNAAGQMLTATDSKGLVTIYTYNDRGLETSHTEASGTPLARTVTTEWDPDRFLPVRIVEPDRTTVYSYDAQGRELSRQTTSH